MSETFESPTLWLVGRGEANSREWALIGVFEDEQVAREACVTDWHFVGPIILNERLPEEPQDWPGSYYPLYQQNHREDSE